MEHRGIELPEGFWIRSLERGKAFGNRLIDILSNKDIVEMIRKRLVPDEVNLMDAPRKYEREPIEDYLHAYGIFRKLYAEAVMAGNKKAVNLMVGSPEFCEDIFNRYGTDGLRDFLAGLSLSLVNFESNMSYYYNTRLSRTESQVMEFERALTPGAEKRVCSMIPYVRMEYAACELPTTCSREVGASYR